VADFNVGNYSSPFCLIPRPSNAISIVQNNVQGILTLHYHFPTMSSLSSPIERLPADILYEIFWVHVWQNLDTPVRLCLVSKLWYSVASAAMLWGRIYYGDALSPVDLDDEQALPAGIDGMVTCSTAERLNQMIKRTKATGFELTACRSGQALPLDPEALDADAFSAHCRALRLLDNESFDDICILVQEYKFPALKEFWYLGDLSDARIFGNLGPWDIALSAHSPKLVHLFTKCRVGSGSGSSIFSRIKKLTIRSWRQLDSSRVEDVPDPSALANLEELAVDCFKHAWENIQGYRLMPSMPRLTTLSLSKTRIDYIPKSLVEQITHLTLNCFDGWKFTFSHRENQNFSRLTHLVANGSWSDLHQITAPKLVSLVLHNAKCPPGLQCWQYESMGLEPEILHMDVWMSYDELEHYLQVHGRKMKEISLTFIIPESHKVAKEITCHMIGGEINDVLCPKLRRLDLLLPSSKSSERMTATRRVLQTAVDARWMVGCLQRVRYGLYPMNHAEEVPSFDVASRKWWNVEWHELLWL
jgi:hypothetical protein